MLPLRISGSSGGRNRASHNRKEVVYYIKGAMSRLNLANIMCLSIAKTQEALLKLYSAWA